MFVGFKLVLIVIWFLISLAGCLANGSFVCFLFVVWLAVWLAAVWLDVWLIVWLVSLFGWVFRCLDVWLFGY